MSYQADEQLPEGLRRLAGRHRSIRHADLIDMGPLAENGDIMCVVETPAGSRTKYDYDPHNGLFRIDKILPAGMTFPFSFGFIPMTLADDGDPLDVLVMLDEPGFPGVLVQSRLLGILKADQTDRNGRTIRNDRVLAVHAGSIAWQETRSLSDLPDKLRVGIEHFFQNYNELEGRKFQTLGWHDAHQALEALLEAHLRYRQQHERATRRKAG